MWSVSYKWALRYEGEKVMGLCMSKDRIILIDRALTKNEKIEVFLHEAFHAVCFELKVHGVLSEDVEEVLAENFPSFLLDNFNIRPKPNLKAK
jgi:hypothetical protein